MDDMADLSDLEQRLAAAIGRMRAAHHATRAALVTAQAHIAERASGAPSATEYTETVAALDAAAAEIARLRSALEAERADAASLAEQVTEYRDALAVARDNDAAVRAAGRLDHIRSAGDDSGPAHLMGLEQALDRLRAVNVQLRQNNAALRRAHAEGLADVDLVNAGLQLEIDALTAARAADRAEIDSILAALHPIVEETEDA